jgi:hypothetical protein
MPPRSEAGGARRHDCLSLLGEGPPADDSESESEGQRDKGKKCTLGRRGIGNRGVNLAEAVTTFGDKLLGKPCQMCGCKLGDPDPLNNELTMAWHKPHGQGKTCAYCGVTCRRRYPQKDLNSVAQQVATSSEAHSAFHAFRSWLINEYLSGNQRVREGVLAAPLETVSKLSSFNLKKRDSGSMKLLDTYVKEFGDPETNGKGHKKARTINKPYKNNE